MPRNFVVKLEVVPKPGISNPVVATINRALPQAFPEFFSEESEHQPPELQSFGKLVTLVIAAASMEDARSQVEDMKTEAVISNPVIEDATIRSIEEAP